MIRSRVPTSRGGLCGLVVISRDTSEVRFVFNTGNECETPNKACPVDFTYNKVTKRCSILFAIGILFYFRMVGDGQLLQNMQPIKKNTFIHIHAHPKGGMIDVWLVFPETKPHKFLKIGRNFPKGNDHRNQPEIFGRSLPVSSRVWVLSHQFSLKTGGPACFAVDREQAGMLDKIGLKGWEVPVACKFVCKSVG